ncbi:MAG: PKD domain-containing protein [Nocardioides sp.]
MPRLISTLCALLVTMLGLSVGLSVGGAAPAAAGVIIDRTPDTSWRVDGPVYATKIVGDKVFLGGQFSNAVSPTGTSVSRKNLAAFSLTTGALLTTWSADATSIVRALESDGTSLYVGGSFPQIKGVAQARLAKVDLATGAVDTAFAPTVDSTVRAIAVDGAALFIGGSFTTVSGVAKSRLAKVTTTTGALVTTFAAGANSTVYGFAVHPTSRIVYLAGNFTSVGSSARTGMAGVNADTGALDPIVFANAAQPTFGLSLNENGSRLFAAGGGATNAAAAWNTASGSRLWRQVALGDNQAIKYFDGVVYFGFHEGFQTSTTTKLLAADAVTGAIDPDFVPAIIGYWGVWSLDVTADGLVIGGEFDKVSGIDAEGWARFPRLTTLPPAPPNPDLYLTSASSWKYWDKGSRPAGWETTGFNDSAWASGLPQLGYGDGDETTVISYGPSSSSKYITSYFRSNFTVATLPDHLDLTLASDDGAVVYVNGAEAVRDNMPGTAIGNTTRASSGRSGGAENELRVFELDAGLLRAGANTIAVEVHQDSASSTDLTFDADLKGRFDPPPNALPVPAFFTDITYQDVTFDGTGSSDLDGTIVEYRWNFGDGTTGTGAVVDHSYPVPGTYSVALRVTDSGGARDTVLKTITVESPTVTTTPIAFASGWKWRYAATAPDAAWLDNGYDDSAWTAGNGVLGFGHSSVLTNIDTFATTAERPRAAYFRKTFTIADLAKVQSLTLNTVANDGAVYYVNGVEVNRTNMPAGAVGFTSNASSSRSAATASANPVVVSVPLNLLVEGANTIAVETHLNSRSTTDVTFDLEATQVSAR